jgi:Fur family ferric uptake transcriptional regulator
MTHAQVADELAARGFDRTSVYRNLVELTEVGLLNRLELGDHVWRFESRDGRKPDQSEHLHFVCEDCGDISCLPGVSVESAVTAAAKGAVGGKIAEVLLRGQCGQCLGKKPAATGSGAAPRSLRRGKGR